MTKFNPGVNLCLVRVGRRIVWEVLSAVHGGKSVLDQLDEIAASTNAVEQMRVMLEEDVPANGPRMGNVNFCRHLGGGVFEFRRGPRVGPKIRVTAFYDKGRRVVCVEAFLKRDTPGSYIDRARAFKRAYEEARDTGRLEVTD